MSFSALGLSEELVRAVTEEGYTTPSPIQLQAIPAVLAGGDLLAGAQTGTGKTAGFVLPILQRLSTNPVPGNANGTKPIRALILTPTRELAAQVEESVQTYGKYVNTTSTVVFGGVGINPQIKALRQGIDILVATPGRLLDHLQQGTVDLSRIEILVLDEADRMLDMGFIKDIKRVLAILPKVRQNLLFSATFSDEIKTLADSLLNKPAMIEVARRNSTVEAIAQKVHPVDRGRKAELLTYLIKTGNWVQVLVFTRTKHGANKLAELLNKEDITAMAIHGNKSQSARTRALAEFKDNNLRVLVATDIAARGIDIDQLPHVVNYDMPNVPEDYVHRIGRTGRAGATGEAISLVCVDELEFLFGIEKLIKRELPEEIIAGFIPDPTARPEPIFMGSQGRGRNGGGRARNPGGAPRAPGNGTGGGRREGNRDKREGGGRTGNGEGNRNRGAGGLGGRGGNGSNGGARGPGQGQRPNRGQSPRQPFHGQPAQPRGEVDGNRAPPPAGPSREEDEPNGNRLIPERQAPRPNAGNGQPRSGQPRRGGGGNNRGGFGNRGGGGRNGGGAGGGNRGGGDRNGNR